MAASVPLLALDEDTGAVKAGGKSSARERRKKTTRRLDPKRSGDSEKDSLDLTKLERDGSPRRNVLPNPGSPLLAQSNLDTAQVGDDEKVSTSHDRKKAVDTLQRNRSARARRSHSKRQQLPELSNKRLPSPLPPLQTSLEDSTTGVANLLRKKLELDDSHGEGGLASSSYGDKDQDQQPGRRIHSPGTVGTAGRRGSKAGRRGSEPRRHGGEVGCHGSEADHRGAEAGQHGAEASRRGSEAGHHGSEAGQHGGGVATETGDVEEEQVSQEPVFLPTGRPLPPINTTNEEGTEDDDAVADSCTVVPPVTADIFTTPCTDILGIVVHGTDELKASIHLTHPSVRISIVDASNNGSLLKKSTPEKCVTSYYERGNPSVDYILPVLTQPYDCRQHRAVQGTLKAEWEEMLTFNEKLTHFTENENVVIFFEVVDFVSKGVISRGYTSGLQSEHRPWHRIAWAFVRPIGKTCRSKLGQKIRLQLYKYKRNVFQTTTESSEVYALWSTFYRSTYPSTLYVTLQDIPTSTLPDLGGETTQLTMRSMFPLQEERGTVTFEQMVQQLAMKSVPSLTSHPTSALVSASLRLPGQPCKIPTSTLSTFSPTPSGCSSLAFSHSGHLLAAACADQNDFWPLILYNVPLFEPVMVLEGHRGIIYSLCWDQTDNLLASASADRIVKVWCMDEASSDPWVTLPHPCYVYCACFMTDIQRKQSSMVATGAYDGYIRVWTIAKGSSQISAEFQDSSSRINCLLWCTKKSALYAGDSSGVLSVWKKRNNVWKLRNKSDLINGQALVSLCLHPNGRRMLLHTLKQTLSMVDLRIDCISCDYTGVTPAGLERCAALLSPCGTLVFAGAPNGAVHVWNTDTGKQLYVYSDLPFSSVVGAMAYHPSEHILVLSAFGTCQPIIALNHIATSATTRSQLPADIPTASADVPIGTSISGSAGVKTCDSDPVVSQAQLKVSQKWSDLAKTIERISGRIK